MGTFLIIKWRLDKRVGVREVLISIAFFMSTFCTCLPADWPHKVCLLFGLCLFVCL